MSDYNLTHTQRVEKQLRLQTDATERAASAEEEQVDLARAQFDAQNRFQAELLEHKEELERVRRSQAASHRRALEQQAETAERMIEQTQAADARARAASEDARQRELTDRLETWAARYHPTESADWSDRTGGRIPSRTSNPAYLVAFEQGRYTGWNASWVKYWKLHGHGVVKDLPSMSDRCPIACPEETPTGWPDAFRASDAGRKAGEQSGKELFFGDLEATYPGSVARYGNILAMDLPLCQCVLKLLSELRGWLDSNHPGMVDAYLRAEPTVLAEHPVYVSARAQRQAKLEGVLRVFHEAFGLDPGDIVSTSAPERPVRSPPSVMSGARRVIHPDLEPVVAAAEVDGASVEPYSFALAIDRELSESDGARLATVVLARVANSGADMDAARHAFYRCARGPDSPISKYWWAHAAMRTFQADHPEEMDDELHIFTLSRAEREAAKTAAAAAAQAADVHAARARAHALCVPSVLADAAEREDAPRGPKRSLRSLIRGRRSSGAR